MNTPTENDLQTAATLNSFYEKEVSRMLGIGYSEKTIISALQRSMAPYRESHGHLFRELAADSNQELWAIGHRDHQ